MKKVAPDLVGSKFGRLSVIERNGSSKGKEALWKCKCDCGGTAIVSTNDLRRGHTKSCGCLQIERTMKISTKHGMSKDNLFFSWNMMKSRCFRKSDKHFNDYGNRGITVCDEWKNSFQAFYDYVSQLQHFGEEGYSLDRINNDGNYEPGNVKWSTMTEQCRNRRNNIIVNVDGKNITLPELSEITGVNYNTLYSRYKKGIFKAV